MTARSSLPNLNRLIGMVALISFAVGALSFFAAGNARIQPEDPAGIRKSSIPVWLGSGGHHTTETSRSRTLFDPANPLSAEEYWRLYEEGLRKEAKTNLDLRKVLGLYEVYRKENEALIPIIKEMREWTKAAKNPQEKSSREAIFKEVVSLTDMLAVTYQWKEADLASVTHPEDPEARKRFAKSLILEGLDPGAFLGDAETARAAINSINRQLYEKLETNVEKSFAPKEWFNQQTYDLMINSSLLGYFKAQCFQLASPATQKLGHAEYQMRTGGRLLGPGER